MDLSGNITWSRAQGDGHANMQNNILESFLTITRFPSSESGQHAQRKQSRNKSA